MTLLCMHKVFPTGRGKQTIVMSLGDVTVVMLTQMVGVYKENAHEPQGSHLGFVCCTLELPLQEQVTLCCGYFGASLGVRVHLYRKVCFICSTASVQCYLGYPELVLVVCKLSG